MAKAVANPGDAPEATETDLVAVQGILAQLDIEIGAPEGAAVRIAEQLSKATTLEDLLDAPEALSWRERADVPYRIRHIDWSTSDIDGGVGIFAIVTAVNLSNNTTEVITTGATNVLIQLAKLKQKGWLNQPIQYTVRKTNSGFEVGRLRKAEDPGDVPY